MALNPDLTGILDESTPEGSLFDDASESTTAVETGEQTPPAGQPEAQAGSPDPAKPAGAAPAGAPVEPFVFGGREWGSREEAENDWKSWEGRIQAEQSRARELEKRVNEYWDYVQAVSRENDEFRAKVAPEAAPKADPKADAPTIDFDQIGRIMEIARNQGMDPMAVGMKAYAAQAEKVYEHKLNERLAKVEQPIQDMQNATAEQTADREMFLWAQGLKDANGQPAFPELQKDSLNNELVINVHRVWKQLSKEFGPKYAYSAPGFDYAYRLAKDLTPGRPAQPAATPPANPGQTQPRDDQGRFTASQAAAAAAGDIAGNTNPMRPRATKTATQELLEELTAVKPVKIGTTELGFFE